MKEYIIILNFETNSIHIHHVYIDDSIEPDDKVIKLGYKLTECEYMITSTLKLNIS